MSRDRSRSPADLEVRPATGVLSREIGDETVLLDPTRGTYFGLDEVGTVFWRLLQHHRRLCAIHRALLDRYDVSADRLWLDLDALVRDLEAHGLVTVERP